MGKMQVYLNPEKDKELIEWIKSLDMKDAVVLRNALYYMFKSTKGDTVNLTPYLGGNALRIDSGANKRYIENEVEKPDEEFEKTVKNSIKGLIKNKE
jgi:hypothetical protein